MSLNKKTAAAVIAEETGDFYHYFNRISDAYSDIDLQRYTVVVGDTAYAISLTDFVSKQLGWLPYLVVVTDQLSEEQKLEVLDRFTGVVESPATTVVFENDTSEVSKHFSERWPRPDGSRYYRPFSPAFVLGSRLDKDFADSIGAVHLSVAYPVSNKVVMNTGYAGYHGGLHLVEDIYSTILNAR